MPPTPLTGLHLNAEQSAKLTPMLADEDKKIAEIVNSSISANKQAAEIQKIRDADRTAEEHILTPEQYKRLVLIEADHDGAVINH
jgi:hypothetical protein